MTNGNDAMTCACARERLSAANDGEEVRTPELTSHLVTCSACRDFSARIELLSTAFAPLREIALPESMSGRVLAAVGGGRRELALFRATAMRIAAGLLGLVSIGALGLVLSTRSAGATARSDARWLEPLAGRALHPGDVSLRSWSDAMGIVMNGDRR